MTDVKGRHRAKMKQTRTLADWPNGGTSIMNRDAQPKDLAIESSADSREGTAESSSDTTETTTVWVTNSHSLLGLFAGHCLTT